jgi:carboxyl-terminal processing protease
MKPIDPDQPPTAPRSGTRRSTFRRGIAGLSLALAFVAGIGFGRLDGGIAGAATASMGPTTGNTADATTRPSGSPSEADELALIKEAWDAIHKNFVDASDLDDRELAYGAIDGLAEAVGDTGHTEFMTPEERAAERSALSGSYVGIGAEVDTTVNGLPLIVGVFRESPADKAGLHAGDVVLEVDGKTTRDVDLEEVIRWIRGEAGSQVVLTVRAGDEGAERTLRITRADVTIEPVSWALVPGTTTAVLRLEQFSSGATTKLRDAIGQLKAAGATTLILDLRGNPGGYVNEAVGVGSEFLSSGTLYISRNAAGEEVPTPVSAGGQATDIPLVVLVDEGTASAAEIVAGAIQDAGRAKLVGVKTFGTGTVLGEFPLSDGSALRIGTVEWLTPKGRVIWHEGITPDVDVERPAAVAPIVPDDLGSMTPSQATNVADPQLKRAIELATER